MSTRQAPLSRSADPSLSVFVIEDDVDARRNLADILELDGYTIHTAGSFSEAIAMEGWDDLLAVVLDRRLPDGTADTILPRLRQRAPTTPVVVITGFADLEGAIAALQQGAADYILKPVNVDSLRARLRQFAESRRMREALAVAQQKALQSERLAAIGQMVTGLAHESRNALQRSQACLEMLAMEVNDRPVAMDLLGRIQKAQDELHALYEEVRDYAAPMRLRMQAGDLQTILRLTWEHLALKRGSRNAHLEFHAATGFDTRAQIDVLAIGQVFRNILENSLSACTDPTRIMIDWQDDILSDAPAISVTISDNGPGLSAEARTRIFEPFFTTKNRGTGLGMAISSRVVEAHGGTIEVVPSDAGARIRVSLPRQQREHGS